MNRLTLDRLVDEHVALNATTRAKYPPATRLALDMARAGACGQPQKDRQRWGASAQELGDFLPDHAASEPLLDLAHVLKNADDTWESHEECAKGLGGVWRAQNPFRRMRAGAGDPYAVLVPQLKDAAAARALDWAGRLRPLPSHVLAEHSHKIDTYFAFDVLYGGQSFSRTTALALLGVAEHELEALGLQTGVIDEEQRQHALTLVRSAKKWVEAPTLTLASDMKVPSDYYRRLQDNRGNSVVVLPQHQRLYRALRGAHVATSYVDMYQDIVPKLQDAERTEQAWRNQLERASGPEIAETYQHKYERALEDLRGYQSLFPDYYPEHTP